MSGIRSRLEPPVFAPGAVADPIWSNAGAESAPGPRTSGAGAAPKIGGSTTLFKSIPGTHTL